MSRFRWFRPAVLVFMFMAAACASAPETTACPDSSRVTGTECHLAPDGSYYGDAAEIPADVADDTADVIDDEVNDQSGVVDVEVVEIEIGGD